MRVRGDTRSPSGRQMNVWFVWTWVLNKLRPFRNSNMNLASQGLYLSTARRWRWLVGETREHNYYYFGRCSILVTASQLPHTVLESTGWKDLAHLTFSTRYPPHSYVLVRAFAPWCGEFMYEININLHGWKFVLNNEFWTLRVEWWILNNIIRVWLALIYIVFFFLTDHSSTCGGNPDRPDLRFIVSYENVINACRDWLFSHRVEFR